MFAKAFQSVFELCTGPGVLDPKTKLLIAMAINASRGERGGVFEIAKRLRQMGAKEKEIVEALRVASLLSGLPGIITGLAAYEK